VLFGVGATESRVDKRKPVVVCLADGSKMTGMTLGFVQDETGLFLFLIAYLADHHFNPSANKLWQSGPSLPPNKPENHVTNPPDSGPTISGRPTTSINVESTYAFRPTMSDPNGGTLTFSVQNKPIWATFDTTSDAPIGTPGAADAGTYANIVISVSDGKMRASLPAFTLTVQQISNGTVTLDWTAPTENTDGTVLSNLGGYRVRYGTTAGNLTQSVELANAGLTSYVVSNLSSGTWFFGVSAYSTTGVESSLSGVVSQAFL
jgi:hypothetical protein